MSLREHRLNDHLFSLSLGLVLAACAQLCLSGSAAAAAGPASPPPPHAASGSMALLAVQQSELNASDGADGNYFGCSVAISGDTALVGTPGEINNQSYGPGAAYVFTRSGTTWVQQAKLTASDGADGDYFGYSVALSGDTALVGAYGANGFEGAAYVFTRSGTTWTQQAELTDPDVGSISSPGGFYFGGAVALDGDTALIGADATTVGGQNLAGTAFVFTRAGTGWSEQAKLTAADVTAEGGGEFGSSVALYGDTALIGAPCADVGALSIAGAAYIFTRSWATWSQQAELTASDAAENDEFGYSVALCGNTALVGAPEKAAGSLQYAGAAYIFRSLGPAWSQQAKLTGSDAAGSDQFGNAVALTDGGALVGARGKSGCGACYEFTHPASWVQQDEIGDPAATSGAYYSCSLALSGDTALIGADQAGGGIGAAYVFTLPAQPVDTTTPAWGGWSWLYAQPQDFPITGFAAAGNTLCAVSWGDYGAAAFDSTDGGASWLSGPITPAPSQSPLDLDGVTFSTPTDGWAVGGGPAGGVAVTSDGGLTWNEQVVTPAGGNGWLSSVSFVSDQEGWVAGRNYGSPNPCVYHTTDGGQIWAPETLPSDIQGQSVTSIEFPDASHGWLLTDAGWVLESTDGGADWAVVAQGDGAGELLGQCWLDPQHGWLVGEDGAALRTTNGGLTWLTSRVFPGCRLTGVAFGDALHGWAVNQSLVFATSDGGATWHIQAVPAEAVQSVVPASASHAYLWGPSGVLNTTTGGQNPNDTTPPALTLSKAAGTWFNHDVKVTLVASDTSGILADFAALDRGGALATSAITVPTSAGQGLHSVTGVAVDNAGNGCAPKSVSVGIDTLAPTKSWTINHPTVVRGRTTTLKYRIYDPLPGCDKARATLCILNLRNNKIIKKISLGVITENKNLGYRYRCTLPRGVYRWGVKVTDIAGNACALKNTWVWTLTVK